MSLAPQFGSGVLYASPNSGNLAANPTPLQFGILQEVQVELKGDLKKLYGNLQVALAKARGKIDITGKGKIASIDLNFFSQLYFGLPTAAGVNRPVFNEAHAAGASVAPTNMTAATDLGVVITSGGSNAALVPGTNLTAIASGTPTTGQYKFTPYNATGPTNASYTFAAADVTSGLQVAINYVWPDATHGYTLNITNQLMGYTPDFQAILYNDFNNSMFALQLNSCAIGGITIPTKQEDFWIADFDFVASADAFGNIGAIYADQI